MEATDPSGLNKSLDYWTAVPQIRSSGASARLDALYAWGDANWTAFVIASVEKQYGSSGGAGTGVQFASQREAQAYRSGKAAVANCAMLCTGIEKVSAFVGLGFLNSAEANQSGTLLVTFGQVPNWPDSPGSHGPSAEVPNQRGIFINTNHEFIGKHYQLEATVVHEVFEAYGYLLEGNPVISYDERLTYWHRSAIQYAEDPALLGAGLTSRTSRTAPGEDRPSPY